MGKACLRALLNDKTCMFRNAVTFLQLPHSVPHKLRPKPVWHFRAITICSGMGGNLVRGIPFAVVAKASRDGEQSYDQFAVREQNV